MPGNPFSRLAKVAASAIRRPKHFFCICEQETQNLSWAERLAALGPIPEVGLTDLVSGTEVVLNTITFRAGGSSVPDYLLLTGLCQQSRPCNYFEIGTFMGESMANVAPFCEQCISLSLGDEEFAQTEELGRDARRVSRMFSQSLPNVKHLYGDSLHYDFGQITERFDVILVDGCHDYSAVVSDTAKAMKLLRNDQSVVVFHDAKNAYNEIEPEVMVGIHDGLPVAWRKYLYTVENTLCAIATRRPLKSFARVSLRENPYAKPSVKFGLTVRINEID